MNVSQTDIPASNGLYYHVESVLLPGNLQRILPNRCDVISSQVVKVKYIVTVSVLWDCVEMMTTDQPIIQVLIIINCIHYKPLSKPFKNKILQGFCAMFILYNDEELGFFKSLYYT